MSLTPIGWLLVLSSLTMSIVLLLQLRSRISRIQGLDLETCKAGLEDIGVRLKRGLLSETDADMARLALLSRPRPQNWSYLHGLAGTPQTHVTAAAVFLLVSGLGAAASYGRHPVSATGLGGTYSDAAADGESLARLKDYARSIAGEDTASHTAARSQLPDIDTMIERLAARLETTPQDLEGWRMLGRSYFHTARYDQAATAFARALTLDPNSAELKQSYDEAKAKASN